MVLGDRVPTQQRFRIEAAMGSEEPEEQQLQLAAEAGNAWGEAAKEPEPPMQQAKCRQRAVEIFGSAQERMECEDAKVAKLWTEGEEETAFYGQEAERWGCEDAVCEAENGASEQADRRAVEEQSRRAVEAEECGAREQTERQVRKPREQIAKKCSVREHLMAQEQEPRTQEEHRARDQAECQGDTQYRTVEAAGCQAQDDNGGRCTNIRPQHVGSSTEVDGCLTTSPPCPQFQEKSIALHQIWEVVGGEDKGGILVREAVELSSDKLAVRLATGSTVRELSLVGERLHFELVRGAGPATGWVSIRLNHKDLLEPRGLEVVSSAGPVPVQVAHDVGPGEGRRRCACTTGAHATHVQEEEKVVHRPEDSVASSSKQAGGTCASDFEERCQAWRAAETNCEASQASQALEQQHIPVIEWEAATATVEEQPQQQQPVETKCGAAHTCEQRQAAQPERGPVQQQAVETGCRVAHAPEHRSKAVQVHDEEQAVEIGCQAVQAPEQKLTEETRCLHKSEQQEAQKARCNASPVHEKRCEATKLCAQPQAEATSLVAAHAEEQQEVEKSRCSVAQAVGQPQALRGKEERAPQQGEAADAGPSALEGCLWQVVGGEDKGGILVREGLELSSEKEDIRLHTGSLVWQLEKVEERLHYELLLGEGPPSGWVSIRLHHKMLLALSMAGVTREHAVHCIEVETKRQEAERMEKWAKAAADYKAWEEARRREQEEAECRAKEAAESAARELARKKAQQDRELAKQMAKEEAKRRSEEAKRRNGLREKAAAARAAKGRPEHVANRSEAVPECREWSRADVDRLELRFCLDPQFGGHAEGFALANQPDMAVLKRQLIKRLRREEDEFAGQPEEIIDLPHDEDGLLAIAERIFELEGLKDLVHSHLPAEALQRQALGDLLCHGVGSVGTFLRVAPLQGLAGSPLLQGGMLEDLLQAGRQRSRGGLKLCEVVHFGKSPVLATAPHNAFLLRDGQPPHQLEQYTSGLAQQLARELDGEALCWTKQVQWRTAFRFSLGVRRRKAGLPRALEGALDPAFRDPNYLRKDELSSSPWFCCLESWAGRHSAAGAACMLHVDVHGCQDPPMWPTHAILGLGAMRQRIEELPDGHASREPLLRRLHTFASLLEPAVAQALAPALGCPPSEAASLRGLAAAVTEAGERVETLSGAWPPADGRFTQTQQSISHVGASHAVQLEMSLSLRKALVREPSAVSRLARALRTAWQRAVNAEN